MAAVAKQAIAKLESQKTDAVSREDYAAAGRIKDKISEFQRLAERLDAADSQKRAAAAREDFAAAETFKKTMDGILAESIALAMPILSSPGAQVAETSLQPTREQKIVEVSSPAVIHAADQPVMAKALAPSTRILKLEPECTLQFGRDSCATLKLTNVSSDNVAFKMKINKAKLYTVRPSSGFLVPGESQDLQLVHHKHLDDDSAVSSHCFLLQAVQTASAECLIKEQWAELPKNKIEETRLYAELSEQGTDEAVKDIQALAPFGRLLKLEPDYTLQFNSRPNHRDSLATLKLINVSSDNVAFKAKVTRPKLYLIRPSSGLVLPGESQDLQLFHQQHNHDDSAVSSHRFLIQAVHTSSTEALTNEQWAELPKDKIKESQKLDVEFSG